MKEYKGILVFAEQRQGVIQNVAFELLGKARELAEKRNVDVTAALLGYDITDKAQELIAAGADRVVVVDNELLKDYLTEPYTQAITQIVNTYKPEIMLLGATTMGRDLGPRLSARLWTGLTADCTSLDINEEGELMMTRPAFGGNLMATILCSDYRPQMSTVRPGVMTRAEVDNNRQGEVVSMEIDFDLEKCGRVKLIRRETEEKKLVDITEANVLVAGGRGVGDADGFKKLQALAEALHAEVASSRTMVDAGIVGSERQVGQTGKTVRPDLYIANGISGAIQHLAGMEDSDYIIAINQDKFAPIFDVADLGVVGDLHQILPLLTEKIKALKAAKGE